MDLVVLLGPFWLCRPPVIPSRLVYPLDSQFESMIGLDGLRWVLRAGVFKQNVHRWPSG